jgi:chaperone required for assembly of F1-ATPase
MQRFDAPLAVTAGIVAVPQPASSLASLGAAVAGLDLLCLTAVADLTGLMGSLLLALALWDGRLTADAAADAALLDEDFQIEQWGADEEATQRLANIRAEIAAGARFIALHRAGLS